MPDTIHSVSKCYGAGRPCLDRYATSEFSVKARRSTNRSFLDATSTLLVEAKQVLFHWEKDSTQASATTDIKVTYTVVCWVI
jgi:hypothetical protein